MEFINWLKKDIIKYELNKIEKGMKKDLFGFIVGWFILELFIKVVNNCDKFIFKKVR